MAELICKICKQDSGYTESTTTDDKTRSVKIEGSGEENRLHFCSTCWDRVKHM